MHKSLLPASLFPMLLTSVFAFFMPAWASQAAAPQVTVPTPAFSPGGGTYTSAQTVTISDAASNATIYYTTNGSSPTTKSTRYSAPIDVSENETLKAIAAVKGETTSAVATAVYKFPTAKPAFSPKGGTYSVAQKVTLSDTTSGATIYYTTDGSTPTVSSTVYTTAISVQSTETLQAIAIATGHTASPVGEAIFTIEPRAATPKLSVPGGLYNETQTVKLTTATKGATIYYTLDGSTPTTGSNSYTGPVRITTSETLKAVSVASGYLDSAVASAAYRIVIETVLHSFNGGIGGSIDAAYPQYGYNLIQANDGNFYGVSVYGGANASSTEDPGAIFKMTLTGVESIFYSFPQEFCNPDGHSCPLPNEPTGGLIQASDGNLYGAALGGGDGPGSIYKISLAGIPKLVYEFGFEDADANAAEVQLVQGRDGNFYGASYDAGAYSWGAAFSVTPGGAETVLHSFGLSASGCLTGNAEGCQPSGALIEGADGAFYGTTADGGIYNQGTIYKVTTGGVETMLYSFGATSTDGTDPRGSLILGSDGNFYGVSVGGGSYSCGTVFQATPAGVVTVLYSFGGYSNGDGCNPNGPLVEGPDDNFYGTTGGGGTSQYGMVFEVTPTGVETVLYNFQGTGSSGPDGGIPTSLTLGKDGNFYGVTNEGGAFGEGTIFKLTGVIPAAPLAR